MPLVGFGASFVGAVNREPPVPDRQLGIILIVDPEYGAFRVVCIRVTIIFF